MRHWFTALVLAVMSWGSLPTAFAAVSITDGPRVTFGAPGSAVVEWTTDGRSGSRVYYGKSLRSLVLRAEGSVGTQHRVELTGLEPNTHYVYTVGTARVPLATNSFATAADTRERAPNSTPAVVSKKPAAPAAAPVRIPSTRETWGNLASLQDHFDRHGGDFASRDPDEYARQAWEHRENGRRESWPMKLDDDGVLRVFDPKSRSFGAYNRNGTTRTFFKPSSRDYFERQPGRPVKPRDVNF